MAQDHPRLGILMMIGFCILAPFSDALVKLLGDKIPLIEIVFFRFVVQLLLVRKSLWTDRHDTWMQPKTLGLIFMRSALHMVAIALFFLSLRFLPLADAIAIAYILPFLVLGWGWVGGEKASLLRVLLCLAGFVGTLLVVQPSFAEVGWPAILPVIVAVLFTGFMFATRRITRTINAIDLQGANGISVLAMLLPIWFIGNSLDVPMFGVVSPSNVDLFTLISVGALGVAAHLCMTLALKFASAPSVAPVQYFEIPCAAFWGLLFFGDLPNGLAAIGIVVTITAGIGVLLTAPKKTPAAGAQQSEDSPPEA